MISTFGGKYSAFISVICEEISNSITATGKVAIMVESDWKCLPSGQ